MPICLAILSHTLHSTPSEAFWLKQTSWTVKRLYGWKCRESRRFKKGLSNELTLENKVYFSKDK